MRTPLAIAFVRTVTPAFALSGQVACDSQSMTICQDAFCFASFDPPSAPSMRLVLDLDRKTYIVRDGAAEARPMHVVAVEQTEHHYGLKLTVELADHHTGNVSSSPTPSRVGGWS